MNLVSIEEILSFLISLPAELDGMVRAVMIAGKASQAFAIMLPLRLMSQSTLDVLHRAHIGTDPAFHATVAVDMKASVGHQSLDKEGSEQPAIDARPMP